MDDEYAKPGLRWDEGDVENASRPSRLHRADSKASIATSVKSHRQSRQIDPNVALPVQYRTLSYQISESKNVQDVKVREKAKDSAAKDFSELEWHTITVDEAIRRLTTSTAQGLSLDQVTRRVEEYGRNAPSPPETHIIRTWLGYLFKGFGPILFIGAVLVFISWKPLGEPPAPANLALAIVLVFVFVAQAAFNGFQDWSSTRVMNSIKNMLPEDCLVLRNGAQVSLPAFDLVPGDIVYIKAGNKLPADVRFVQVSSDAKMDRSILTGESVPLSATVESTDINYLETRCIGLQGTHCVSGSCTGLVVSTGDHTVFGRLAALTQNESNALTTLEREILYFVLIIVAIMFTMIAVILLVWGLWLRPKHPSYINVATLIVDVVSVAIAFIPEGLPIAVTANLTITANLMRQNMILCKSLKTVETLGTVSVICSDKTGTLTQNKMTVTDYTIGHHTATAAEAEAKQSSRKGGDATGASQLRALSSLCNAAEFDAAEADVVLEKRRVFGDATDQAILRFAERLGSVSEMRQAWAKTFELAFNSKNKFMIRSFSLFKDSLLMDTLPAAEASKFRREDTLLTIKGAPDVLIGRCSYYTTESGETLPFDTSARGAIEDMKNVYSSQGKRCILLARKILSQSEFHYDPNTSQFEDAIVEEAKTGLTLVGLVAIVDPLRPEIRDVVKTMRGAGIRFFMVTGDFALTALAIAQDAGIISNPSSLVHSVSALPRDASPTDKAPSSGTYSSIVVSGPEMLTLTDHQWSRLVEYDEIVFARTTPEQKLRIVNEFQKNSVVAMTGDGVNDAPSLKAADVGIALGSGSDVAIEASDMVLLDTFSSVVEAVKYGRVVFDNMKKVVCYLLPAGSFSEFWPVFTSVVFGMPQILSSFLMIIICCFTDCAAATVMSYEQPEADLLLRKPRDVKKDRLVDWQLLFYAYGIVGIVQTVTSFAMSFFYLEKQGIPFSQVWFSFGKVPDGIDPDFYTAHLNTASSIYFVNLVVMQWFNLLAVRTRRWSIFQQPPIFNPKTQNWYIFPAIIFSLLMAILWLYIPQLHSVLGTVPVPVENWFIPFGFGLFILLLDEARKYVVRGYPNSIIAKMAW
ncbi:hypothetical protein GGS21DRAFT_394698 [Xylaria nigripes]|nr:hypothetical protein GGS21DRAFT_394698 [Xylaria nigripes]